MSNIDVTQNAYGKNWWEERVYAFAARCTRQPSCGRLSKRRLPAQTSAAGQFPITNLPGVTNSFAAGPELLRAEHGPSDACKRRGCRNARYCG
jgi:hypothetical protein